MMKLKVEKQGEHLVCQLSWEQVHALCNKIIGKAKIRRQGKYKGIIAVTRGGMIPAYFIAAGLGIKRIKTVCVTSYDDEEIGKKGKLKFLDHPKISTDGGKDWLIVDDIVDSGETLEAVKEIYKKADIAVLLGKGQFENLCRYMGEVIDEIYTDNSKWQGKDVWIIFPWESLFD